MRFRNTEDKVGGTSSKLSSKLAFLSQKLPLAIIYASWAGLGVFSVALLSSIFYKQTLTIFYIAIKYSLRVFTLEVLYS